MIRLLLLILQRYEFSSKSQLSGVGTSNRRSWCWYYKGTNFQANHNTTEWAKQRYFVVADTSKVRIFKQITTSIVWYGEAISLLLILQRYEFSSKSQQISHNMHFSFRCCWYYKGTNFQANHNHTTGNAIRPQVVADTTKVRIFKQITTTYKRLKTCNVLLLILQRYEFSSKSQHLVPILLYSVCCCWYYKGTNFQANHNILLTKLLALMVVADTTKVRIFKQITTANTNVWVRQWLLLILQRYEFSSKSQQITL